MMKGKRLEQFAYYLGPKFQTFLCVLWISIEKKRQYDVTRVWKLTL